MSGNRTYTDQELTRLLSDGQKIAIFCAYALIFLVGTFGNALVVYIFGWRKRKGRKNSEFLLMSLGVTDFVVSMFAPPWAMFSVTALNTKYGDIRTCLVGPLVITTSVTVSQMLLILICYDRYRVIVTPMKERFCRGLVFISVSVGILLGILISLPPIIRTVDGHKNRCFDYTYKPMLGVVYGIASVTRDIIAFSIMAYFIRKMLIALKEYAEFRKAAASIQSKDDEFQRTKKILYLVLVFFAICICPPDILNLFLSAYYFDTTYTPDLNQLVFILLLIGMILQIANSCVNVFIYSAMHPEFKKVLNNLWRSVSGLFQRTPNSGIVFHNASLNLSTDNVRV